MIKPFWKNKALLAPMAGVTDAAFREIAIDFGAGFTYTEMVSSKGLEYGSSRTRELISPAPDETTFGIQLFGTEPQSIARSIEELEHIYSGSVAVFDINMGCPAPKITGGGAGCALMNDAPLASRIIETAAKATKLPVTVKIRKGWDETSANAVEFARMAQGSGAAAITVHGRTRQQFYSGECDLKAIADVKKAVSMPVIGNGGIFSARDAAQMLSETGCDAVMIARGALGNPFLFREIKSLFESGKYLPPASPEEKAQVLLRQARLAVFGKGEHTAMLQIRKHAAWYLKGMKGAAHLREAAVKIQTIADLEALLGGIFPGLET